MSDAVPANYIECVYMGLEPCPATDCFYADGWSCPALVRTPLGMEVVPIPKRHPPVRRDPAGGPSR